jgi:hypothetical protein
VHSAACGLLQNAPRRPPPLSTATRRYRAVYIRRASRHLGRSGTQLQVSRDFHKSSEHHALKIFALYRLQGLSAVAVALTTSDYLSLIQPAQTVVAFTASALLGMEPFSLRSGTTYGKVFAVCLTVGGAIFIMAMSSFSGSDVRRDSKNLPLGTAYLLLQVCTSSRACA